jgi:hypothetical protein
MLRRSDATFPTFAMYGYTDRNGMRILCDQRAVIDQGWYVGTDRTAGHHDAAFQTGSFSALADYSSDVLIYPIPCPFGGSYD